MDSETPFEFLTTFHMCWYLFILFGDADLVLKDKIIVYDLGGQRLGWSDYNCKFSSLSTICYRVMQKNQLEEPVSLSYMQLQ